MSASNERDRTHAGVALARDYRTPDGQPDPLSALDQPRIGAPLSRVDGLQKVTGGARFAAEFALEGMVHAALAYSTIARGRITTLDTAAAEAAPGVVLVMTHDNAPTLQSPPVFLTTAQGAAGDDHPVLQNDQVHWNGQPIAVVLAETPEQAEHAASLIRAEYAPEPAVTDFRTAATREPDNVLGGPPSVSVGDAEQAFGTAPRRVDAIYRTPRHNHNAIEPHAVTLAWHDDELMLHDASQCVDHVAYSLAQVFGIAESQVHVSSPFVGGGFGSKTLWQHQILAAAAARVADRPVRLALSREGVHRVVGGRACTEQRVAIGADEQGHFRALIHTGKAAMTAHNNLPEPFTQATRCLYGADHVQLAIRVADLDMLANTFMRAPGESVGTFALESAIDELAEQLDLDPLELRRRNEPERDPTSGLPFSSRHLLEASRAGAERFGWDQRSARPGERYEGEWQIGLGCATATYPYMRMPGAAARITLSRSGAARVDVAAHEMGMGTATVQTQVAAARLGLPVEQVRFNYGDSSLAGVVLAGGSQQTAAIGGAVIAAHRALVEALLELVDGDSPLAGLTIDEIECRDGGLGAVADSARFETYDRILARAGRDELAIEADAAESEELSHFSMHSFGMIFCEAAVSAVTGEVRIRRLLGSFDCGRVLNAKTAASQFRGGMIMGLGLALMEETQFDTRSGRIMNPSLAEYHVPVQMDVPEIEVMWTDIPDPHTPMGARGIGELGITGVGAAVANAVYNACGRRVRELPITLDKLL
ncbi:xanthine dehydrogenase molybdenum binding subunit apoprotein [Kushneria sinocarnis]|uniref:Xanthine dehydrogenase molybdenum binding subunit apoprotein n=1 Tax=Kushneria sinocarnis TaxID=595502 RepID=A0A420X010_9GAMM|nr:xanthine dehydrogenase family protein molybdopterin-binding subunit [Kushneria sinocarnis]RKR06799.1 xanthine dehydrogenase molybdenum binding subunit apoprotein [Kushneria sinocarnis]